MTIEITGHRLPAEVENLLLEICEPQHRNHLRIHLDLGSRDMVEGFMEALLSGMDVHQDVCESDPQEICVRATGQDRSGSHWRDMNIILLAPSWASVAPSSEHVAELIVDNWDALRKIAERVPAKD